MKNDVKVPTGIITAIGKIKVFKTKQFNYSIPTLSFVVAEKDGIYTASCLHLLLDASGKTAKSAIERLQDACADYLSDLFNSNKSFAWEHLAELVAVDESNEFWKGYRKCQILLYEKGINTENSYIQFLEKTIQEYKQQIQEYRKSTEEISISIVSLEVA